MYNSLEIKSYLKDVNYPANREFVIDGVENSEAPYEVLAVLSYITDKQYDSPEDVLKEIEGREPLVTNMSDVDYDME